MLEHVHHRVPVTALAYYDEHVILSGEGNVVRAYDVNTQQVLANLLAFDNQAVHGIIVSPGEPRNVVVWGGSSVRSIRCDGKLALKPGKISRTTDWILDAAVSPGDGSLLAFVTAHNALAVTKTADIKATHSYEGDTIHPVVPGSNCILYSAHVTWLSASKCLVASGTAFGDVILWSATLSEKDGMLQAKMQTHYTFSAHEGSVFGVQLSSELDETILDGRKRILASCSDDRTVKLWDVSDLETSNPTLTEIQRETGFGSNGTADENSPPCLAKAMGHASRVWQVRFVPNTLQRGAQAQQRLRIMSFGEDASNVTWALEASALGGLPCIWNQTSAQTAHSGKHIWSVSMMSNGRFATGGADGAIAIRTTMEPQICAKEIDRNMLGLDPGPDNFKAYSFVDNGVLIATTDRGRIVSMSIDASGSTSVSELSGPLPGLRGYSVVASVSGVAFLAGSDGVVYQYVREQKCLSELAHTGQKTAGLFACSHDQGRDSRSVSLLVTSVAKPSALLLRIAIEDQASGGQRTTKTHQWQLELPQGHITTSYTWAVHHDLACAIVGARNGSVAIYTMAHEATGVSISPSAVFAHIHEKEAVTALYWTQYDASPLDCGFLHSTGRDGTQAVHRLEFSDDRPKAELMHKVSLPFGPNIEGLAIQPDRHLWVWGFRSKHFVVHDVTAQREIMSVECGGAHRNWTFRPQAEGGTFVWTQASKLFQQTQHELRYRLLNSGGHGREIKAVAVSPSQPQVIATGAEDTNIKLSTFDGEHGFQCLQTLRKHNTGIQHLQWSDDGSYLFSSGGFEEFFVWKVSSDIPDLTIGVSCESAHPSSGTSDLRIMGFEATASDRNRHFEIAMAYSDSALKLWKYQSGSWRLLAAGDYLTACLTQTLHLKRADNMQLTTATDGHLAIWDKSILNSEWRWATRHQIHQSAILAVASCDLSDGSHLLVTGGDDNAIGLTRIASGHMRTMLLPRAHAAAVTGLVIVSRGQDQLLLASASIDQRPKVWLVDLDVDRPGVDGINVEHLADGFTAVADVSSLGLYRHWDGTNGVLVCGVGMDMWRLGSS